MGAAFNEMTLPGDLTWNEVVDRFEQEQEDDRYENGHSYSGGFGMARGLTNHMRQGVFPDQNQARDWLIDNCQKWQDARAVSYLNKEGQEHWMIGAWCAS